MKPKLTEQEEKIYKQLCQASHAVNRFDPDRTVYDSLVSKKYIRRLPAGRNSVYEVIEHGMANS